MKATLLVLLGLLLLSGCEKIQELTSSGSSKEKTESKAEAKADSSEKKPKGTPQAKGRLVASEDLVGRAGGQPEVFFVKRLEAAQIKAIQKGVNALRLVGKSSGGGAASNSQDVVRLLLKNHYPKFPKISESKISVNGKMEVAKSSPELRQKYEKRFAAFNTPANLSNPVPYMKQMRSAVSNDMRKMDEITKMEVKTTLAETAPDATFFGLSLSGEDEGEGGGSSEPAKQTVSMATVLQARANYEWLQQLNRYLGRIETELKSATSVSSVSGGSDPDKALADYQELIAVLETAFAEAAPVTVGEDGSFELEGSGKLVGKLTIDGVDYYVSEKVGPPQFRFQDVKRSVKRAE